MKKASNPNPEKIKVTAAELHPVDDSGFSGSFGSSVTSGSFGSTIGCSGSIGVSGSIALFTLMVMNNS